MEIPTPSLLWIASHLRHPSGHAEEARAALRALEECGFEPSAIELGKLEGEKRTVPMSERELAMLVRQIERAPSGPVVAIHAYTPKPERRYSAGAAANVARVMFETDRLPDGWAELLAERDQVWVPSRHNHEVFASGGIPEGKLRIVTETLDFDAFDPGAAEPMEIGAPADHFVFLTNFDFSERKGWRQLLLGWAKAFEPGDPVCLVLKTLSVAKWDEDYVRARILHFLELEFGQGARDRLAPIELLPARLSTDQLPGVYAAADAYVSVSRGEAWGRTYMEAMAMGLPTVGSRYGGNLDFMNDEESWLIDGELVPVGSHSEVLNEMYRGHRWFEADVDQLAAILREIASDPAAARAKASGARDRLVAEYAPVPFTAGIAELAKAVLAEVASGQPTVA
jgi:glycosyltransferase involved in cell wall biosynthesis